MRRTAARTPEPESGVKVRQSQRPAKAAKEGQGKVPHDPVNERVLIAAAIVDKKVRHKLATIPPDSFYAKGHAEAWSALQEIDRRGLDYDPETLRQIGGEALDVGYLEELARERPEAPPNLAHHVEMLKWDRARVEAVRGPVSNLLEALRDPTSEPEKVRAMARQVGSAFDGFGSQRYLRDPQQLTRETIKAIRDRRTGTACYPFGIEGLDQYGPGEPGAGRFRLLPGAAPKHVTLITGLSGSGKTTVTAAVAVAMANQKRKTLYGAWEQGSSATLELCASQSLGISRSDLIEGRITDEQEDQLRDEMDRLGEFIQFFEIPFGRQRGEKRQFNDQHLDTLHGYIADTGCDVFIADLFRRALRQFDPDEEEHALYRMQAIVQESHTHLIAIHQIRLKDVEQRADKRPTREGIKGSGAWVEMPDTILGVHRQALWKQVPDDTLEIDVLKQRKGKWPLAVEFDWDPDTGRIWRGRGIEYARPGSDSAQQDSFLDAAPVRAKGGSLGKRGR